MQLKGVYGLESLDCGCIIKRYLGGKTIFIASTRCIRRRKHKTKITFVCGVCELTTTKRLLKIHKEREHSI